MTIQELVTRSHQIAKDKGWHDEPRTPPECLMLIVSEAAEALEEYHIDKALIPVCWPHGDIGEWKPEGFGIELADIVIRVADFCGKMNWDLEELIRVKQAYNETCSYRMEGKAF